MWDWNLVVNDEEEGQFCNKVNKIVIEYALKYTKDNRLENNALKQLNDARLKSKCCFYVN